MAAFIDEAGRQWTLRLDYTAARQIRKRLGLDLLSLVTQGESFGKLADNIELLANTLCVLCEDQCEARGISDEDFGRGLAGDCFGAALVALQECCISFLPPPDRAAAAKLLKTLTGARAELAESLSTSGV